MHVTLAEYTFYTNCLGQSQRTFEEINERVTILKRHLYQNYCSLTFAPFFTIYISLGFTVYIFEPNTSPSK